MVNGPRMNKRDFAANILSDLQVLMDRIANGEVLTAQKHIRVMMDYINREALR